VGLAFTKMHGLGNDFVVIDARSRPFDADRARIRRMADRHAGIGFDQLLVIENATEPSCAYSYRIWNTDGSTSQQCGNGARCIAAWLARAGAFGAARVRLQSPAGPIGVDLLADGNVRLDMGEPRFAPADIPFDAEAAQDRYAIDLDGTAIAIGAVSMGNPHALVEVNDLGAAPVAALGAAIDASARFPEGCNVGFAEVRARDAIGLRVWERGVGETRACGSGACAAVAVLRSRDTVDARVRVQLPGGELEIHWPGPGACLSMTGPATFVYEGEWHE
jgi:diaminopimelate epimerase